MNELEQIKNDLIKMGLGGLADGISIKRTRFSRPTVQDVAAFCEKRKNGIDPQEFWHFYNSKGWKIGKSPMKSWESAVLTWERNKKKRNNDPGKRIIGSQDYYN